MPDHSPADLPPAPVRRAFWRFVAMLLVAGAVGYLSRKYSYRLPGPIRKRTGDALWASSFFALFRLIRRDASTASIAIFTLVFSFCIEFSQRYHAPWIDSTVRANWLGRMILGTTFYWLDLIAYVVGVAAIVPFDLLLNRRKPLRRVDRSPG